MQSAPEPVDSGLPDRSDEIAAIYGLGPAQGPMVLAARGEQGPIWRLETTTGAYAVKELVVRQTDEDVARDVAFQERATAGASTYEVARTLRTVEGHVLAHLHGSQVRVQQWLDLLGPDPSIDPQLVGRMLAELHLCGEVRSDEVDPWYTAGVGEQRWSEYVDALTSTDAAVATRLARAVPQQVAFERLLTSPNEVRTCHRDLWSDNVRMTAVGRLCVFDWDNCGPADVNHELAVVLWEFGLDDAERIRLLHSAYVDAGGPGRVRGPGDLTMLIAQFGHFYELAVAPFLRMDATDEDRVRGVARFDEFDDRPLTEESIAQVIGICSS